MTNIEDFRVSIVDGYLVVEGMNIDTRIFSDYEEANVLIDQLLKKLIEDDQDEPSDNKSDDPDDQEKE